ncbi:hypothetical protein QY96_02551 [Bacillus thermotolerans]|nr:hypothetical protein QY96_02551 [Bacillus thermotolerans]
MMFLRFSYIQQAALRCQDMYVLIIWKHAYFTIILAFS